MENPDVLMFGLMSSLKTQNIIVDMFICLAMPVFFPMFWQFVKQINPWIREKTSKWMNRDYIRTIENSVSSCPWTEDTKVSHKNGLLLNAVRQYVGRECKVYFPSGDVKLEAVKSAKASDTKGCSVIEQLEKHYRAFCLPQKDEYVEIEPGLFYKDAEIEAKEENRETRVARTYKTTYVISLKTSRKGGQERVDSFVRKAYDWYVAEVAKTEDNSRFMYQPLVAKRFLSEEERKKPRERRYKRYVLSSEKTFASLFFPEKERLLAQLKHFSEKTGKYAIKGFPHKLGILLYGPPGTGKTSLVKAIAQHTKRHIISVPLSRIQTNQELMDVMFDQVFNFGEKKEGEEDAKMQNRLKFDEVIFLLEDIDAASNIVQKRKTTTKETTASRTRGDLLERAFTSDFTTEVPEKKKETDEEKQMATMLRLVTMMATKKEDEEVTETKDKDGKEKKKTFKWESEKDKLDLAGFLNVLDGVVDAPGRILIMTTNHPEKLDPALTRPGRINMQVLMGFMRTKEACEMVAHYYKSASPSELKRVQQVLTQRMADPDFKMSPAEMEQFCAECTSVEDLIKCLKSSECKH